MRRSWLKKLGLPLVLLPFVFSCDDGARPLSRDLPFAPQANHTGDGYTIIEETLPSFDLRDLTARKLIGTEGGTVCVFGHCLAVPAGAVDHPVMFVFTRLPTAAIEVDLAAHGIGVFGHTETVGSFENPVTLSLTYSRATNVTDPEDLVIVYMPNGDHSVHEPLPSTVNTATQTVSAELSHFSRYCMASN